MFLRVTALFFSALFFSAVGAAQTARPGAKPGPASKPAAKRQRTPAEEARDEWNRGAVAYRTGKFADAQRHFERARELDPKMKDVRLYIARSIQRQYRPGVEDPENVAKAEAAVAAFEAILAEDPGHDDALRSLVALFGQMRQEERARAAMLRRANDASVPLPKRADALLGLAGTDWKCAQEITERKEHKESAEQGGKVSVKYKMPADVGEFYKAQQCATNGLMLAEQAVQLAPESIPAWTSKVNLLQELAKLAEMEGNPSQKEFYTQQRAEAAERRRALGGGQIVEPGVVAVPSATDAAAQPSAADGAGGTEKIVSAGVLNNKTLSKPLPDYPAEARAARVQGVVTVQIVVDEEGRVTSATAISGPALLREAAAAAARQARFAPTLLSGQPVKVSGIISYDFTLE
jgi:TonB family protein